MGVEPTKGIVKVEGYWTYLKPGFTIDRTDNGALEAGRP